MPTSSAQALPSGFKPLGSHHLLKNPQRIRVAVAGRPSARARCALLQHHVLPTRDAATRIGWEQTACSDHQAPELCERTLCCSAWCSNRLRFECEQREHDSAGLTCLQRPRHQRWERRPHRLHLAVPRCSPPPPTQATHAGCLHTGQSVQYLLCSGSRKYLHATVRDQGSGAHGGRGEVRRRARGGRARAEAACMLVRGFMEGARACAQCTRR